MIGRAEEVKACWSNVKLLWVDGWTIWILDDSFKLYASVEEALGGLNWKARLERSVCDAVCARSFWEKIYHSTYNTRYNRI